MNKKVRKVILSVVMIAILSLLGVGAYSFFTDYAAVEGLKAESGVSLEVKAGDGIASVKQSLSPNAPDGSPNISEPLNKDKVWYKSGTPISVEAELKEGYAFKGWYNGEELVSDQKDFEYTITGYTKLDAVAKPIDYTITYNLNGGKLPEGVTNPNTYTVESDEIVLNNPTKPGYEFKGWTGSNGDEPQTTVTIPAGSTGDKTFTANWEAQSVVLMEGGWIEESEGFNYVVLEKAPNATSIVFTDEVAPAGVAVTDVSAAQDGGVVAWLDGTTYKVSTQRSGVYVKTSADAEFIFAYLENVKRIDLSKLDTSDAVSMREMFDNNYALENITFGDKWNTSKVADFSYMFNWCKSLTSLDVSSFDTSSATVMCGMFGGCQKVESITFPANWDTSDVYTMAQMFQGCKALKSIDMSGWDTTTCYDFRDMFDGCENIKELDLSSFNNAKVPTHPYGYGNMANMFKGMVRLERVTLGADFAFYKTDDGTGYLPAPDSTYITGADGHWYDSVSGYQYAPDEVPNNTAATYVVSSNDTTGPELTVNAPAYTTTSPVTITGTVKDEGSGIKSVVVNGVKADVDENGNWTASVPVVEGKNTITVVATDNAGNSTTKTAEVFFDKVPPVISGGEDENGNPTSIKDSIPDITNQETITVTGKVEDNDGIDKVIVNGKEADVDKDGNFSVDITLKPGDNEVVIEVTDKAGNKTTVTDDVIYDNKAPELTVTAPTGTSAAAPTYTNSNTVTVSGKVSDDNGVKSVTVNNKEVTVNEDGTWSTQITVSEGSNTITVVATDIAGNKTTENRYVFCDKKAPTLDITTPADTDAENPAHTNDTKVTVSGTVKDDESGIDKVTVNGQKVEVKPDGSWTTEVTVPENQKTEIKVEVTDNAGNKTTDSEYVYCDTKAPELTVTAPTGTSANAPTYTNTGKVTVTGTVTDVGGVESVTVNGTKVTVNEDGSWSTEVSVNRDAATTIAVIATDKAGNTDTEIRYARQQELSKVLVKGSTFNDTILADGAAATSVVFTDAVAPDTATVTDVSAAQDGGVVAWLDGTTYYVSTQRTGVAVEANASMMGMFANCANLTSINFGDNFDTSKTTSMSEMFERCSALEAVTFGDKWTTKNVTSMGRMFLDCKALTTLDVANWDVSKVTGMNATFQGCSKLETLDVSKWDTSKLRFAEKLFYGCEKLKVIDVSKWNTSSIEEMNYMFYGCKSATTLDVAKKTVARADGSSYTAWDTSKVNNMQRMFYGCSGVSVLDVSNWNVSKVTDMGNMFGQCTALGTLDVSKWNTSLVQNMDYMFDNCAALTTLDVSKWVVDAAQSMNYMFSDCKGVATLDVSNWNVSNVRQMNGLFKNCSALTSLGEGNVSNWTTTSLEYMYDMFKGCVGLTVINFGDGWDTSGVKDMGGLFSSCESLTSVTFGKNWDTSKVTDMGWTFYGCSVLKELDLSNWDTSAMTSAMNIFTNTNVLEKVTIGEKVSGHILRSPQAAYITGADGMWYDIATSQGYTPTNIPKNKAATYVAVAYDITYNLDGGALADGVTNPAKYTKYSEAITLNNPTKEGYTFGGWYENADFSGSAVTQIAKGRTGNKTFYAKWNANSYTVKFNGNGSTSGSMSDLAMTYGTAKNLSENAFTRSGYSFKGWNTKADGSGTAYADKAEVINLTAENGGTVDLYAQWEELIPVAQAIYSADDNSLTFVRRLPYTAGEDTFTDKNGKTKAVTAVYTGFESATYAASSEVPWNSNASSITSVVFEDEINPTSTAYWFRNFDICGSFDVSKLNVSTVTNMSWMFGYAGQNATTFNITGLNGWDTSNVTDMSYLFYCAGMKSTTWNIGNLSSWKTSNVTTLQDIFCNAGYTASTFDIGTLSGWDTSNVTNMREIFYKAGYSATTWYVGDLSSWKTSNVTNMFGLFGYAGYSASTFDIGDLSGWDTSNVTNMATLFQYAGYSASTFDIGDLSNWNTAKVTRMSMLFQGAGYSASTFNIGTLSGWDTSNVTTMQAMFSNTAYNSSDVWELDLSNWDTSKITGWADMSQMFTNCRKLWKITLGEKWTWGAYDPYLPAQTSDNIPGADGKWYDLETGIGYAPADVHKNVNKTVTYVAVMPKAFAVYSATDKSLRFYKNLDTVPTAGSTYKGRAVTAVYTGFETAVYTLSSTAPWRSQGNNITSVVFEDEIKPISTAYWFNQFRICTNFDLAKLNTSKVTNMEGMFYSAGYDLSTPFTVDLSSLDTSNVTNMHCMFYSAGRKATKFTLTGLNNWDTSKVTDMANMFGFAGENASTFDIDGLSGWNTGNVTVMLSMFSQAGRYASTFDIGDLSGWNTSNVTNMYFMFNLAGQNATTWSIGDLSGWDTSEVTDMTNMFAAVGQNATPFEMDLSGWDATKVTTMQSMFNGANIHTIKTPKNIPASVSISSITSKTYYDITDNNKAYTAGTFPRGNGATSHTLVDTKPPETFAVYSATDNSLRFYKNSDTVPTAGSTYKGRAVTNVYTGFETATYGSGSTPWNSQASSITSVVFEDEINPVSTANWFSGFTACGNIDVSKLNTSNVTDMSNMFFRAGYNASTFNIVGIGSWNTSKVTNMTSLFDQTARLSTSFNIDSLSDWDVSNVTNMSSIFYCMGQKVTTWDIGDLSGWNTSNVTTMQKMFNGTALASTTWDIGDLSGWDTSNVTDMSYMFSATAVKSTVFDVGNLGRWDTSNVTNMSNMFASAADAATTLNLDGLSDWDTSKVTDMSYMFQSFRPNVTTLYLDLSGWDTSKVTNMKCMFATICQSGTPTVTLNLSGWDTSNVTNMYQMFSMAAESCTDSFNLIGLSGWDTSNVTDMDYMFWRAGKSTSTLDLSGWKVGKVTSYSNFKYEAKLTVISPNFGSAASLALKPAFELPEDVTSGEALTISAMPNVAKLNEQAAENAPENTELYAWLVDSGMAQDIIELADFEEILHSVYDEEPEWEMTITPLYKAVEKSEEEVPVTEPVEFKYVTDNDMLVTMTLDTTGGYNVLADGKNEDRFSIVLNEKEVITGSIISKNVYEAICETDFTQEPYSGYEEGNEYIRWCYNKAENQTNIWHYIVVVEEADLAIHFESTVSAEALDEALSCMAFTAEQVEAETETSGSGTGNSQGGNATVYNITYEANGGMMPETYDSCYEAGKSVTLPAPVKEGFTFCGWYENADFSGDAVTEIVNGSSDKTFYAKWEVVETEAEGEEATDPSEGTDETEIPDGNIVEFLCATDNDMLVTMALDTTDGYNVLPDEEDEDRFHIVLNEEPVITGSIITKDEYEAICETDFAKEPYSGYEAGIFKVDEEDPNEEGRESIRWCFTDAEAQTTVWHYIVVVEEADLAIHFETTVSAETLDEALSCMAFAAEQIETETETSGSGTGNSQGGNATVYDITYEVNGGMMPQTYDSSYDEGQSVTLPVPTKEGYTFLGWYENADFSGDAVSAIVNGSSDKTFYAKWEAVESEGEGEEATDPSEGTDGTEGSGNTKSVTEEGKAKEAAATEAASLEPEEPQDEETPAEAEEETETPVAEEEASGEQEGDVEEEQSEGEETA